MGGGAVASWLVHSTPDRVVRGHCVVFLGKTCMAIGQNCNLHVDPAI